MSQNCLGKYEVIKGEFECKECGVGVKSARFYKTSLDLTWRCSAEHVTYVSIKYERGY